MERGEVRAKEEHERVRHDKRAGTLITLEKTKHTSDKGKKCTICQCKVPIKNERVCQSTPHSNPRIYVFRVGVLQILLLDHALVAKVAS